jgi:hypothetical protein
MPLHLLPAYASISCGKAQEKVFFQSKNDLGVTVYPDAVTGVEL